MLFRSNWFQGNLDMVGEKLTHSNERKLGAFSNISTLLSSPGVTPDIISLSFIPKLNSVSIGKRLRTRERERKAGKGR